MASTVPLSILDLAIVARGATPRDALEASVAIAQRAETRGYRRVWYAEHHNMAAHRVVGDQRAHRARGRTHHDDPARRRRHHAAEPLAARHRRAVRHAREPAPGPHRSRPRAGARQRPGHRAGTAPRLLRRRPVPGRRPRAAGLPLRRLARRGRRRRPRQGHQRSALHPRLVAVRRAARRACSACRTRSRRTSRPQALEQAVAIYRREFRPSVQLATPYVMAGVNVIAADTDDRRPGAASSRCAGRGSPASSNAGST